MEAIALPQLAGSNLLTHSRVSTFRTCARKHFYSYELGVKPTGESKALRIGSVVHKALEKFWSAGGIVGALTEVDAFYATPSDWVRDEESVYEWECEHQMVRAMVDGYVRHYHFEAENALHVELEFSVPIRPTEKRFKFRGFQFAGKIDAIVATATGTTAVMEHKTTSEDISPTSDYWARLNVDQQITGYMVAARHLGFEVQSVIYDVIRKPGKQPLRATPVEKRKYTKEGTLYANQREHDETPAEYGARIAADIQADPTAYYVRREITRTERDLDEFKSELYMTAEMIREAVRKVRHPRNTSACTTYGRCPYLDVCYLGLDIGSEPPGLKRVENVHPELTIGEVE